LQDLVAPLDAESLQGPSRASEWSIAQVLSHLGSQAEIFNLFLDAGLRGEDAPGNEAFPPIWEAWNSRDPQSQATDALRADEVLLERLESLTPEEKQSFHLKLFGMEADIATVARMRLGEVALHRWDVEAALNPSAEVAPEAVALLVDTLGQFVARGGKYDGTERHVRVSTTRPERQFTLEIADPVALVDDDGSADLPELALPAEAFIRLLYGRLDPAHTPPVEARGIELDELRGVFPGI
jgi:uncharacterized protein (TIGR03083 family)